MKSRLLFLWSIVGLFVLGKIAPPKVHEIPPRIQNLIQQACGWYYEWFYPNSSTKR